MIAARCLVLALAIVAGCGQSREDTRGPTSPPILWVGLDGLEWNVVLELIRAERLPTLAALMQRGTFGHLETFEPAWSPVIWTSMATGRRPEAHGITGFVHSGSGGREQRLFARTDRKVKALWTILSERGRRNVTVGWWVTYPAEPVEGYMVAQVNTVPVADLRAGRGIFKGTLTTHLPGQVHPATRERELLDIVGDVDRELASLVTSTFGAFSRPLDGVARRLWDESLWAFRADAIYHRIAVRLLDDPTPAELFSVYFGGTDVVGHRFWRHAYPDAFTTKPPRWELDDLGDVVADYYAYVDHILGDLIAHAPANAVVLVTSDHGMHAINLDGRFEPTGRPRALRSGDHRDGPPGLFIAAGPGIRRSGVDPRRVTRDEVARLGSVLDLTPTILTMLDLPVGRDMEGTVIAAAFEPEFAAAHPVRRICSHEPWCGMRPRWLSPPPAAAPELHPEARLEQLRQLGYIQ